MTSVLVSPSAWYLMRGSGLVTLALLSGAIAIGVLGTQRWQSALWPRFVTGDLHRNVSLLAVCFLGVHIVTALVDGWVHLRWVDAVVPFVSPYKPLWVGLGALAVDLLVAVVITSLLRRHIGYRTWRAVHWGTWLAWPIAVIHSIGVGSDTRSGFGLYVVLGCIGLVGAAALWRLGSLARSRIGAWLAEPGPGDAVPAGRAMAPTPAASATSRPARSR